VNRNLLPLGFACFFLAACGGGGGSDGGDDGGSVTPPPPSNTAPVAVADSFEVDQDQSLEIAAAELLANDSDADGDTLAVVSVAQPGNGTLQQNTATSWTYTPASGSTGTDSFSYTISDGTDTASANVTITVNEVEPPPPPPPPPPPDASVGGLWSGQFISSEGGVLDFTGLIAETGEFRWLDNDQGQQIFGTIQVSGTSFGSTDAISALPLNVTTQAGSRFAFTDLDGTVAERVSLDGEFTTTGEQGDVFTGTFTFDFDPLYSRTSSLAQVQGSYTTVDDSLTIDATGQLFYQSSANQCVANGAVEVINASYNMYRVTFQVDSCEGSLAARNGLEFSGLAYLKDTDAANDTLEFAVSAARTEDYLIWRYEAQK